MPDHLFRHLGTVYPFPGDPAKKFALRYASRRQPIIDCLFHPTGNWNRSNMTTLSDEIHYCPMLLAALEMVEREFDQFSSSQSATQQNR